MAKVDPEFTEEIINNEPQANEEDPSVTQEQADSKECEQQGDPEVLEDKWKTEREELVNQILRLKADFDNYKRRNQATLENVRVTANENLINDLLPVIDNFERSLQSAAADSSFAVGVKMIFDQLLNCLGEYGLEVIDSVGNLFDPNLHEAVSMQGDSKNDLVVIAEVQRGYLFKGKLLRASMVQVAPAEQQEEEE